MSTEHDIRMQSACNYSEASHMATVDQSTQHQNVTITDDTILVVSESITLGKGDNKRSVGVKASICYIDDCVTMRQAKAACRRPIDTEDYNESAAMLKDCRIATEEESKALLRAARVAGNDASLNRMQRSALRAASMKLALRARL